MSEDKHSMGEVVRALERIEAQVIKTNGRVTSLEKWRWVVSGAVIALGATSFPAMAEIAKAISGI
jgi:hypothetical protein